MLIARLVLCALLAAACTSPDPGPPTRPTATPLASPTPRVVAHPTVWLCRPGLPANPCDGNLDTTVVSPSGKTSLERFTAAGAAPVDCFYVYPTVSAAKTTNAPLKATADEIRTGRSQAARFASVCRVFAPVYRQLTVQALFTGRFGDAKGRALAHSDVLSAWHDYLNRNPGRRFVLLGHSQGSFELLRLLQEEVDGDDSLRNRLVSALVIGGNLKVPPGRDVGGDLQNIPLCRRPAQNGCVVAYNSYDSTPPADALFGRPDRVRKLVAACTNPAALQGGSGSLSPYLPTAQLNPGTRSIPGTERYRTGFVAYPGYLTAQCRTKAGAAWLQVSKRAGRDPLGALSPRLTAAWGLHAVDVNLALGNLVELVRAQTR